MKPSLPFFSSFAHLLLQTVLCLKLPKHLHLLRHLSVVSVIVLACPVSGWAEMGRLHLREVSWRLYLDRNWVSQREYMEHEKLEIIKAAARVIQTIYLPFS